MRNDYPFIRVAAASLRSYLEALQESGVEGIPVSLAGASELPATPENTPAVSEIQTPAVPSAVPAETLEAVKKDLGDCQRCKLGKTRKNLVFGVGNHAASLVFVGEGPGADEDAQGEPFVGEAGQVLNRIITAMGLKRDEVYICNVVKCRPPKNRDPEADEIAACGPFLLRQIGAIKPAVIVSLGKFASQTLLSTKEPITRLRGKFRDYHGIPVMPTYHPSYLLRNKGNNAPFWEVWDDMVQVLNLLGLPVPEKGRKKE